ncbi:hypothetical protein [Xanthomonas arboricola]|uniref:hypothetical protein n=1 Tax=Xanthomonas arboricola TaxID=56448 RepID=UPI0015E45901|nr:hypothetical protein [Xanthomonas arboricola]
MAWVHAGWRGGAGLLRAFAPGAHQQVAQHRRAVTGGAIDHRAAVAAGCVVEGASLFQAIDLLDTAGADVEKAQDLLEHIAILVRQGRHAAQQVLRGQRNLLHVIALELAVHLRVGAVAVRVRPLPAVVMDAVVLRLRTIADVVRKPADVERAVAFELSGVLALGAQRAQLPHGRHDALVAFGGGVRQGAGPTHVHALRQLRVAAGDAPLFVVQRQHEGVARARRVLHEGELLAEPAVVGVFFDLEEGFAFAAPAVRQRGAVGDHLRVLLEKDRAVVGQGLHRGAVDGGMRAVAPGGGIAGTRRCCNQQRTGKTGSCHGSPCGLQRSCGATGDGSGSGALASRLRDPGRRRTQKW